MGLCGEDAAPTLFEHCLIAFEARKRNSTALRYRCVPYYEQEKKFSDHDRLRPYLVRGIRFGDFLVENLR
jgi:hypothetical protein